VLFGGDRRLFEVLAVRLELEIVRVIDTPEARHIRYCVGKTLKVSLPGEILDGETLLPGGILVHGEDL